MLALECFEAMATFWKDQVVVCSLGMSAFGWFNITKSTRPFYMTSSMGLTSSLALGLSVSLPQATVWALDSDGSLTMNLSCLLTAAGEQPPNMTHFVLWNKVYQTIGGHPLTNGGKADLAGIARAAGIEEAVTVSSVADVKRLMQLIAEKPRYRLVILDVEPEERGTMLPLPIEGPEMKYRFARELEQQFGIQVLGPRGY